MQVAGTSPLSARASLLTFSLDGSAVSAHRLVMRVIWENLAATGFLTGVCRAAAQLLVGQAAAMVRSWHEDRGATRDLVEQIIALDETAARCPADSELNRRMTRLRRRALTFLTISPTAQRKPSRSASGYRPTRNKPRSIRQLAQINQLRSISQVSPN